MFGVMRCHGGEDGMGDVDGIVGIEMVKDYYLWRGEYGLKHNTSVQTTIDPETVP